jgi:hypothetical protein
MKLKIISNGSGLNTRIVNLETGEELENVVRLKIIIDGPEKRTQAVLELTDVPFDVIVDEVHGITAGVKLPNVITGFFGE